MKKLPVLLTNLESIIKEAGKIVLKEYLKPLGDINVTEKPSGCVTEIDLVVERFYCEKLSEILPEATFLGEELGGTLSSGYQWIIDPIDGTRNFISKIPLFVTAIALAYNKKIIFNGVYDPVADKYYCAYFDKLYINGISINIKRFPARNSLISLSSCDKKYRELRNKFGGVRRLGSAILSQCWLAEGRLGCAVFNRMFFWDIAPTVLILKNSGVVSNFDYNKINHKNFIIESEIVCAPKEIFKDFKF